MSYELTFLGTSGGPLEHGNCALLVKPASLSYLQVLESKNAPLFMVDAGSGWHALAEVILSNINESKGGPGTLNNGIGPLKLYDDSLSLHEYLGVSHSLPFSSLKGSPLLLLKRILSKVATVLISHPHLDHIQAMVLNLAGATDAENKLVVHASKFVTDALNNHIFNGIIWPDLVLLGFLTIEPVLEKKDFAMAQGNYSVTYFEVSHGIVVNKGHHLGGYPSLAFLISDNSSQAKLLVFGDFEADTILRKEKNSIVWKHVAPFILDGSLKSIILECSTASQKPGVNLYGHMTPAHIMSELQRLESICSETGMGSGKPPFVKGLKLIITHVKETYDGTDPRRNILSELRLLNESMGLLLNISIATCGVSVIV